MDFDAPIARWMNEHAPQGIFITDDVLVIRGWNRCMELMSGRTSDSVIGRPILEVFPELAGRQFDRIYREALSGRFLVLDHRFHKYIIKLPAKPEYKVAEMQQSAHIAPLIDNGQIVGTITAIEDVTERVVRESDLIAAREAADQANQAKDRFLGILSHDLRTPLTAILGWTRIFCERPGDEQLIR